MEQISGDELRDRNDRHDFNLMLADFLDHHPAGGYLPF